MYVEKIRNKMDIEKDKEKRKKWMNRFYKLFEVL